MRPLWCNTEVRVTLGRDGVCLAGCRGSGEGRYRESEETERGGDEGEHCSASNVGE